MAPAIVWFRRDLRLADNPALAAAIESGTAVIPLYVLAPDDEGDWQLGGAARWWLARSLRSLAADLERIGSRLVVRAGAALSTLEDVIRESGARTVYFNRRFEPASHACEDRVTAQLGRLGIEVRSFCGSVLFEPGSILTGQGEPYRVFTPFWRACLAAARPRPAISAPRQIAAPDRWPDSRTIEELDLEPRFDWASGLQRTWQPGEQGALARLDHFVRAAVAEYADDRDRVDQEGTSRLSPHLSWGEIGPRQIWQAVAAARRDELSIDDGADAWLRQLLWREFAIHLLYHFPHTAQEPLRAEFDEFPWEPNRAHLRAWQRGQTGYPIVDAAMRDLWATGWMHNRLRLIVASFLVKDLLQPWQDGARWFWDTLVDADLANNTLGWQWTAGCGADAAPYFRIFNPVTQARRFDPAASYVRRWLPELAALPDEYIHAPWETPADRLREAAIELGRDYPAPIVDHTLARERALAALKIGTTAAKRRRITTGSSSSR